MGPCIFQPLLPIQLHHLSLTTVRLVCGLLPCPNLQDCLDALLSTLTPVTELDLADIIDTYTECAARLNIDIDLGGLTIRKCIVFVFYPISNIPRKRETLIIIHERGLSQLNRQVSLGSARIYFLSSI